MTTHDKILASLEDLLSEPFMTITSGSPVYEIDSKAGPTGYGQVIAWLQIENVRPDVMQKLKEDCSGLSLLFDKWAQAKRFVSSQILESENYTLVFEVTAIS